MATYYKVLDERSKTSERFPLKIAISHKKKTTYISTGYYLIPKEWSQDTKRITSKYKNSGSANSKVDVQFALVGEVVEFLRPYWKDLNVGQIKEAVIARITEASQGKAKQQSPEILKIVQNSQKGDWTCFYEYTQGIIKQFYQKDRGGSALLMKYTIQSLKAFTGKDRLPFKEIDEEFLNNYEAWYIKQINLKGKRNNVNGLGFKTREIRRIYNMAIKDKLKADVTQEMYPFGSHGYSIKKEKTDNKNIDPSEIAKIYDLELTPGTKLWHHLNYFKYYFECWGMNFADIAYLRVYQVQDGRLKYRRRKTRWSNNAKQFDIAHSPTAQKTINYYTEGKNPSDLVFPIIDHIFHLNTELSDKDLEVQNKTLFENKWNNIRGNHIMQLRVISKKAGLKENVSIYVGRHSFFSIALKNGVSKSEISEMAGHSNFQVTEAYLDGFSGEQLASSANLVRAVIASHTGDGQSNHLLNHKLIVTSTAKVITVNDFLLSITDSAPSTTFSATDLVIRLLQETNCKDGVKAQEHVNDFLKNKDKVLQVKAS